MKRLVLSLVLMTLGSVAVAVRASQTPPAQTPPAQTPAKQPQTAEIQKVKDNLYMITGGGGNTAAFITAKGVVVVDTKNPGWGQRILEKIKSVTDKPVTMIINTHTHADHNGSNNDFPASVEVVAHENTKTNMEKMPAFQGDGAQFLPDRTYRDRVSLLTGNDKIDLYYFGPGHTNGDTIVVFPVLRTAHTGDLFARKGAPLIDTDNGGTALGYPKTVAAVAAGIKGVETVIPGHSAVTDWAALQEFSEYMRDLVAAVTAAKKDGKTVDDALATLTLPEKYKDYDKGRLKDDIAKIYAELQ
jgi:glyoxylase-like metal-dependent hydrolase (beta-lactamase superfamily II)